MAFVKTWDANPLPAIPTSTKASVTVSDNTDIFGTGKRNIVLYHRTANSGLGR